MGRDGHPEPLPMRSLSLQSQKEDPLPVVRPQDSDTADDRGARRANPVTLDDGSPLGPVTRQHGTPMHSGMPNVGGQGVVTTGPPGRWSMGGDCQTFGHQSMGPMSERGSFKTSPNVTENTDCSASHGHCWPGPGVAMSDVSRGSDHTAMGRAPGDSIGPTVLADTGDNIMLQQMLEQILDEDDCLSDPSISRQLLLDSPESPGGLLQPHNLGQSVSADMGMGLMSGVPNSSLANNPLMRSSTWPQWAAGNDMQGVQGPDMPPLPPVAGVGSMNPPHGGRVSSHPGQPSGSGLSHHQDDQWWPSAHDADHMDTLNPGNWGGNPPADNLAGPGPSSALNGGPQPPLQQLLTQHQPQQLMRLLCHQLQQENMLLMQRVQNLQDRLAHADATAMPITPSHQGSNQAAAWGMHGSKSMPAMLDDIDVKMPHGNGI